MCKLTCGFIDYFVTLTGIFSLLDKYFHVSASVEEPPFTKRDKKAPKSSDFRAKDIQNSNSHPKPRQRIMGVATSVRMRSDQISLGEHLFFISECALFLPAL